MSRWVPVRAMIGRILAVACLALTAAPARAAEPATAGGDALPLVLGGLGVVLIYYGAAWWWNTRDTATDRIAATPRPPAGISPAAVRFADELGYDGRCLTAALVSMAVSGWLTLHRRPDGGWRLSRTGTADDVLFPDEQAVARKLFFGMAFDRGLEDADGRWLRQASDALKETLEQTHTGTLFVTDRRQLLGGAVLSVPAAALMMGGTADFAAYLFPAAVFGGVTLLVGLAGQWLGRRLDDAARRHGIGDTGRRALWLLAVALAGANGGVAALAVLPGVGPLAVAGMATLVALAAVFAGLLKAPTRDGRRLRTDIEGLAAYLRQGGGAETAGIAPLSADRYLPYALALDLERAWSAGIGRAYGDTVADDLGRDLAAAVDATLAARQAGNGRAAPSESIGVGSGPTP